MKSSTEPLQKSPLGGELISGRKTLINSKKGDLEVEKINAIDTKHVQKFRNRQKRNQYLQASLVFFGIAIAVVVLSLSYYQIFKKPVAQAEFNQVSINPSVAESLNPSEILNAYMNKNYMITSNGDIKLNSKFINYNNIELYLSSAEPHYLLLGEDEYYSENSDVIKININENTYRKIDLQQDSNPFAQHILTHVLDGLQSANSNFESKSLTTFTLDTTICIDSSCEIPVSIFGYVDAKSNLIEKLNIIQDHVTVGIITFSYTDQELPAEDLTQYILID